MTQTLYNLRHDGEQYRVTKFVDGEVESSYLTTHEECTCPAGHRRTCRHREMIGIMLAEGICDTHWFWDHTHGVVVDLLGTPKSTIDALIAPLACAPAEQDTEAFNVTATEVNKRIAATHMSDVDWTPELDAIIALLPAGLHGKEDVEQTVETGPVTVNEFEQTVRAEPPHKAPIRTSLPPSSWRRL